MSTVSVEQQIAEVKKKLNKEMRAVGQGGSYNEPVVAQLREQLAALHKQKASGSDTPPTPKTEKSKNNDLTISGRKPVGRDEYIKARYQKLKDGKSGSKAATQITQLKPDQKKTPPKKKTTGTVLDTISSQRRRRRVSRSPLVQASYNKKRGY